MRPNADESRLALAAAEGDGEAFAQLYDRYEKPVYNYCLRLLGNEHDAEDATQDAFIKVMRRLPAIGDRELEFGAYLYTAARNTSYDMIGKRKRTRPVEEIADGAGPLFGDGTAIDEDPERSTLLDAERESIQAANARLPARQREVLALRELEGMSYADIADLLEMNANSVAQLISRARIGLRNELRGEAANAITATGPDCERALPLLSRRQDGKLDEGAERDWLDSHLASCRNCPLVAEAIAEAGRSYRAWAPALPAAWLFRDTLAKAAEAIGADWSAVERPAGNGSAATRGSDGGATAGSTNVAAAVSGKRHRRGAVLVASLGTLLLILIFGGLATGVIGDDEANESPAHATPVTDQGTDRPGSGSSAPPADGSRARPGRAETRKPPKPKRPDVATEQISPAAPPASAGSVNEAPGTAPPRTTSETQPRPTTKRPGNRRSTRVAGGTGSPGARGGSRRNQPAKPPAAVPSPPTKPSPPTTPPPAPPNEPAQPQEPPVRDPSPPPPDSPTDPETGSQEPPPTQPCPPIRACR